MTNHASRVASLACFPSSLIAIAIASLSTADRAFVVTMFSLPAPLVFGSLVALQLGLMCHVTETERSPSSGHNNVPQAMILKLRRAVVLAREKSVLEIETAPSLPRSSVIPTQTAASRTPV